MNEQRNKCAQRSLVPGGYSKVVVVIFDLAQKWTLYQDSRACPL
jgi:hypothetical protein